MHTNTRLGLLTLSIITALTGTASQPAYADEVPMMLKRPVEVDAQFKPDPSKRLTMANFEKGMGKLHEYLTGAIKNAKDEDKKFLIKEKAEIEKCQNFFT